MKNFLKKIWNFIKNPKVRLWLILMGVVIVVSVSVMSIIMIVTPVEYSKVLKPQSADIKNITVTNTNFKSDKPFVNYSEIDVATGSNALEPKVVGNILSELHKASKTNRFGQFFGGQAGGEEKLKGPSSFSIYSLSTQERSAYLIITFAEPKYVLVGNTNNLQIEEYDPLWNDNTNFTSIYHSSRVIHKIFIPLGSVKNNFVQHTLFISAGNAEMSYSTSFNFSYTTYANYWALAEYVKSLA